MPQKNCHLVVGQLGTNIAQLAEKFGVADSDQPEKCCGPAHLRLVLGTVEQPANLVPGEIFEHHDECRISRSAGGDQGRLVFEHGGKEQRVWPPAVANPRDQDSSIMARRRSTLAASRNSG